jgi:aminopeptidase N
VINMIEAFVGPEAFRKGVSSYLTRYASSNAAGEDFWNEVTRVTEKPVNRVMRSYVDQPGAPVLSVRTSCVNNQTRVTVRQRRFEGTAAAAAASKAPQMWSLPVCVKTASGQTTCQEVTTPTETFTVPGCGPAIVNADARGYYLTEYEPEAVAALAKRTPALTPAEKVNLLGDEWRMMRAGRHDVGTFLDLAAAFASEPTPAVAGDIAARVGFVQNAIADASERDAFSRWIRASFGPALEAIGLDPKPGDSDDVQARRGTLMQLLGGAGDERVRARARALVDQYLERVDSVPPSLIGPALGIAAGSGDAALYDRLLAKMRASTATPDVFYRVFGALPAFSDKALVERTLALALSDEVRSQEPLTKKLGVFQGVPYIVGALSGFCSPAKSKEIAAFFKAHPVPPAERSLRQALERIDACAAVDTRQSKPFSAWLAKQGAGTASSRP